MARAVHGVDAGGSLKVLAERYMIGQKGTEVINALGKRRNDFTQSEIDAYGEYCKNDVDLTYTLFNILMLPGVGGGFPMKELKVIDATLKMFVEPVLDLNLPLLEQHLEDTKNKKEALLLACVADKDTLMSNERFAQMLRSFGVDPPQRLVCAPARKRGHLLRLMRRSRNWHHILILAFKLWLKHALATKLRLKRRARNDLLTSLSVGSCLCRSNITRRTLGRWGGDDKINLQNLPSRGANANKLKKSICAPEGLCDY